MTNPFMTGNNIFQAPAPATPQQAPNPFMTGNNIFERPKVERPEPQFGKLDSALLGLANGLLQNFGAEAAGLIEGIVKGVGREEGFSAARERGTREASAMLSRADADNPASFGAGEITGAIGTSIVPGAAAVKGAQGANLALRSAGVGAGQGAVFGAGEDGTLEQRVNSAGKGALVGGAFGFGAPVIGKILGGATNKFLSTITRQRIPSSKALATAATASFKEAEKIGRNVPPTDLNRIVKDITTHAHKLGLRKGSNDKALANLRKFNKEAKRIIQSNQGAATPKDMDGLHRILNRRVAGRGTNAADDKRLVAELSRRFDGHLKASVGDDAFNAFRQGRELHRNRRKLELFETAFANAERAGKQKGRAALESGMRNALRGILEDPAKAARLNSAELQAVRLAVEGTFGQRQLQALGQNLGVIPFVGPVLALVSRQASRGIQVARSRKAGKLAAGVRPVNQRANDVAANAGRSLATSTGITQSPINVGTVREFRAN